jgi:hypothetical protein
VNIALVLALGATLSLSAGLSANGKPGVAGGIVVSHTTVHISSPGLAGHRMPAIAAPNSRMGVSTRSVMSGSRNPVVLPAWKPPASRATTGFSTFNGWPRRDLGGEPGVTVVSPGADARSGGDFQPTVNNGARTNRRHLTGTVVAVRPGAEGSTNGTIQLRLARVDLPVINDKQAPRPIQNLTVSVSDATRFNVRGKKDASLGDVHLGQTVRVGLDGRLTREVEVLTMGR